MINQKNGKKFFTVVTDLGFNFSCVNEKTEDRHLVLASSKLLNKFWFTARKKHSKSGRLEKRELG